MNIGDAIHIKNVLFSQTCNTLERAFEIFVHPEKLDIENAYKCAK